MPESLHQAIRQTPEATMVKIMDMMKVRLRYYHEIKNHIYLFGPPDYSTELGVKFQSKIKRSADVNRRILTDVHSKLRALKPENFSAAEMNSICNEYQRENGFSTEDVFYLIRFALSGNPVGAAMADIAEVVGYD